MTDHIDAINPAANIGPEWNGQPASRITVLANKAGQVFDRENGNASAVADAQAIKARFDQGYWSIGYVNQSLEQEFTDALAAVGLHWTDAQFWPEAGVYEWCADPSGNIKTGHWRPPVTPILVQDRYGGPYDLSTVNPTTRYPGRVAGYIDGAVSQWPPDAWNRFAVIPDRYHPNPGPLPPGADDMMALRKSDGQTFTFSGSLKHGIPDTQIETILFRAGLDVAEPTDAERAADPTLQARWDAYVDSVQNA